MENTNKQGSHCYPKQSALRSGIRKTQLYCYLSIFLHWIPVQCLARLILCH